MRYRFDYFVFESEIYVSTCSAKWMNKKLVSHIAGKTSREWFWNSAIKWVLTSFPIFAFIHLFHCYDSFDILSHRSATASIQREFYNLAWEHHTMELRHHHLCQPELHTSLYRELPPWPVHLDTEAAWCRACTRCRSAIYILSPRHYMWRLLCHIIGKTLHWWEIYCIQIVFTCLILSVKMHNLPYHLILKGRFMTYLPSIANLDIRYRRLRIRRDGHLDQSEAYDIS